MPPVITTEPSPAGSGSPASAGVKALLVKIARDLHRELHPSSRGGEPPGLDSSLERGWGFDSLSRAELLLRLERSFAVHLPERLLGEAETLRDLLKALERANAAPVRFDAAIRAVAAGESAAPAPNEAATLTAVLDWHAEHQAKRVHIVHWQGDGTETSLTYGELAARSRAVAAGLRDAGVEPGGRVAIMLPTGEAFFLAFFGALYAGGVPTPIYPPVRPSELEEHLRRQAGILRNAGASVLVSSADTAAVARLLKLQVESLSQVLTVEQLGQRSAPLPGKADPQSLALLQYTSGSTGDPKGVALTHRNVLANIRAMGEAMAAGPADVFVSWLPLYHDMGLIGAWLGCLCFAAPLVIMSPITFLVRPEQWLWAIHRHRATLSAAPNFAFELVLREVRDEAIVGLDLSSLRLVANGSEAVGAETIRRFAARFARYGFRPEAMAPAYGLAENAVGLALPPLGRGPTVDRVDRTALTREGEARPAAADDPDAVEFVGCGQPLPDHEIRIVDATGEIGERREGRLQFRGPSATAGYFENPAKTAELFDGGWLNTGDLAYIAGGEVFITGRSKDIIIRAGRHIHPEEIETAIGDLPGVRKGCVAVFGTKDPEAGTERLVVLAETPETDPALLLPLRRVIAEAAARLLDTPPEEILLVPPRTIPKTASGKLRRSAARTLFEQGRLALRPQPAWRQVLRLAGAGIVPQLRRTARAVRDIGYAAWWWAVVVMLGALLWPLVLALPNPAARWKVMHRAARLGLRLMGIPLQVSGAWPTQLRAIVAVNHASYVDALVLSAVLPGEPAFVAKKELQSQFFAGRFLTALGTLFVERADPEGGVEDARRALAAAQAGRALVFLPEGTFTRAPGLRAFRMGAFVIAAREGLAILPVSLHGTRTVLRSDQWFPRRGPIAVRIGAPILPEGTDFAAAVQLRDRSRAAILAHCGEPDLATS